MIHMTVIDRRSETQKGWQDLKHVSCTLFFPNDFCDGPDSHSHTCLLFSVENHPCFVISSNPPSFQHTKLASTAFPRCTKPLASFISTTHFHSDPTFHAFSKQTGFPIAAAFMLLQFQSPSFSVTNQSKRIQPINNHHEMLCKLSKP